MRFLDRLINFRRKKIVVAVKVIKREGPICSYCGTREEKREATLVKHFMSCKGLSDFKEREQCLRSQ